MYLSRLTLDMRHPDARAWLGDCHRLHRALMSGFGQAASETARAEFGVLFRVDPAENGLARVLVQSRVEPRWAFETRAVRATEGPKSLDGLERRFMPGARFLFRLRANPTRRVHYRATQGPDLRELDTAGNWKEAAEIPEHMTTGIVRRSRAEDGRWWREREDGKRIGNRVELAREEDRVAWLQRRGRERDGFEVASVRVVPGPFPGEAGRERLVAGVRADPAGRLHGVRVDRRLTFATALFEGELAVTDVEMFRDAFARGIGPGKAFGCGLLSLIPR